MTRLGHLSTERARAERAEIDRLPTAELVRLMNEDDAIVPAAVAAAQPAIAAAVDAIVAAAGGGRAADLRRRGDGGAARRARRERVRADVQHRPRARRHRGRAGRGQRGDRERRGRLRAGRAALPALGVGASDAVVGISASGRTPYVLGAIEHARARRAR